MNSTLFPPELLTALRGAERVAVLTGAGISAESGVPTFRDALEGIWAEFDPQELATPGAFLQDPQRVWDWYAWRREMVAQVEPNAGHRALALLASRVPHMHLATQNVDGLHQRAGSSNVTELHGNILRVRCFDEGTIIETWEECEPGPPRCPACNAPLRPDVVWFGEALPHDAIRNASMEARRSDVYLCVGTSTVVHPAAALPFTALESGALVVEINPEPTPLSPHAAHVLRGKAGETLPALVEATWMSPD